MQTKLPWLCAALLGVIGWLIGNSMNAGSGSVAAKPPDFSAEELIVAPSGDRWMPAMTRDFEQSATALADDANELRQAHRLYAMVKHLSAAQMPDALDAAMRLDPLQRAILIKRLLSHWAELDPSAAVHYAESLPNEPPYSEAFANVIGVWATRDFDAATKYIFDSVSAKQRRAAFQSVAAALAKTDPLMALQRLEENLTGITESERAGCRTIIMKEWARKDFDAAAKYALDLQNRDARFQAMNAVAENQTTKSPQDLLNWAKGISDSSARAVATFHAILKWSENDPAAALQSALSTDSPDAILVREVTNNLASRSPVEAWQAIEHLSERSVREAAIEGLFQTWARNDVKAAKDFVNSLPEGDMRIHAMGVLAGQLSGFDVPAAIELANLLPAGDEQNNAKRLIGSTWANSDRGAGLVYLSTIPDQDPHAVYLVTLTDWMLKDPREVIAWSSILPDGKDKADIISGAIGELAKTDPKGAVEATAKQNGATQAGAAEKLAANWAKNDLNAARVWAENFPEGDTRAAAFAGLMETWTGQDAVASAKWLGNLPDGKSRDSAIGSFSGKLAKTDPNAAIQWASTIADEATRTRTAEAIAFRLARRDKEAAAAFVRSTNLLPAVRREPLIESLTK